MTSTPAQTTHTVETARFGSLAVGEDALVTFPDGLLGFADARRFVLVPHGPGTPFVWLQSAERPELAFLLLAPSVAIPGYAPALPPGAGPDASLWVIVTLPAGRPEEMTANLLGPLVIDEASRQGRQLVLSDDRFSTKHRMFPARRPEETPVAGRG